MEITEEHIREAALKGFPNDVWDRGHYANLAVGYRKAFEEGAEWMQKQLNLEWVKTPKNPEKEGWYLVKWENGGINMSYFSRGQFINEGITHWMPLPEPPIPSTT